LLATDLADLLVRRGVPFRESHHIVGRVVRLAEERGCALGRLSDEDLCGLDARLGGSREIWNFERSVEQRAAEGGTARSAVLAQISRLRGS
jgi:argininosuccinate lyase